MRIRTRETLARPEIAQFVLRGALSCGFEVPASVLAELVQHPASDRIGIFLGRDDDTPRGLVVAQLPLSVFMTAPVVVLAYADHAPRELVRRIGARLAEWIAGAGFDHALALNMRHDSKAFCRGLRHFGSPDVVGDVVAFQLAP